MTLDIYIWTGRQGIYSLYSKGICKLTYDEFILQRNDNEEIDTYQFPTWDTIQAEIKGEVQIDDTQFYEIGITPNSWNRFCIFKWDLEKLNEFCDKRNYEMSIIQKSVYSYIDTEILDIAENLLNIAEENIMLNYRIVARCHINYSHMKSEIFRNNSVIDYCVIEKYRNNYNLSINQHQFKGREKKNAEKFNEELYIKTLEFNKLINNFVEIITEEKKINEYVAKAVAWEAIQRKAIDCYSQQWKKEYETILDNTFDELYINFYNQDMDKTMRNYIKSVLLCNEIDIEHSQEILMYFLLSKRNIDELILCDCFIEHYVIDPQ